MKITMDRYEANWAMVEEGWKTHVLGEGRTFASAKEAIETFRAETGVVDQDLPAFVIAKDGAPVGTINDGDSVILFNFRGDRAQEICKAFEEGADFNKFDRVRVPNVMFAGMLQYDADLEIPKKFLTFPPKIKHTLSERLVNAGLKQYAISETQKYGHVTYFWNGNRSEKFSDELETFVEIPSDVVPFEQRPWMKGAEITDELVKAIESGEYDFLRTNYPNGDMVGHTGSLKAAIKAVYTGKEDLPVFYEDADLPKKDLLRIIKDREYSALPQNMRSAAQEAMEALLHSGDGQLCDILIDRATMEAILQAGKEADDPMLKAYAELIVEVTNIKIAVRASKTGKSLDFMKRAMIPCGTLNIEKLMVAAVSGMDAIIDYLGSNSYGEAAEVLKESLSAFERWCDNRIIRSMQPQKMNPFSAGPLIAYVIARENEIKTVRIILTCKQNGLPEEAIRERIREMYV